MNDEIKPLSATEQAVLDVLQEHGPMTDEVLVERSGIGMRSASPRRGALVRRGLVEEVGRAATKAGRSAKTWGVVPPERVEAARAAATKKGPRRLPVTEYPFEERLEIMRQLLDDPHLNDALKNQNGRAWRKVRGRARDRRGEREHERREINRQLKNIEKDPSGLTDFLKVKRNLLDVTEAMRATSEFLQEEMATHAETGNFRIPFSYWPEIADLLEDLEDLGAEARRSIDRVLGRLGDDVIEGVAFVLRDNDLLESGTVRDG